MPRFIDEAKPVTDRVFADVQSAWPDVYAFKGRPRTHVKGNLATVSLSAIPSEFETATQLGMALSYEIVGIFDLAADENVEDAKIARLDALAAVLEASADYNGLAALPYISNVEFGDPDEQDSFAVIATFSCTSYGRHGSAET